jgi:hypothetical protein
MSKKQPSRTPRIEGSNTVENAAGNTHFQAIHRCILALGCALWLV